MPVVVENQPGADAIIGGGAFASAGDDHTLLYGTASMVTVNPLLQSTLPYDLFSTWSRSRRASVQFS